MTTLGILGSPLQVGALRRGSRPRRGSRLPPDALVARNKSVPIRMIRPREQNYPNEESPGIEKSLPYISFTVLGRKALSSRDG